MAKKIRFFFRRTNLNRYTITYLTALLDEYLPDFFELKIVDGFGELYKELSLNSEFISVVGYSLGVWEFKKHLEEISQLKRSFKDKVIIISGGPQASGLPEEILDRGADLVFIGEAEESLLSFLKDFYHSLELPSERIIKPQPLQDFNSYPPFAYKRGIFSPIELRRGCENKCFFCQTPYLFPQIRERDLDYVKKYANLLKEQGKKDLFFLLPDGLSYKQKNKGVNITYLEKFLKELSEEGFNLCWGYFPSEVFPTRVVNTPQVAKVLKKYVQNKKISLGCQTGSPRILELINRDHTLEDVRKAVKVLREEGFQVIVDIILGFPQEELSDRWQTLNFIKDLAQNYQAKFNLHYFIRLPQTPFFKLKPTPIEEEIKDEIYSLMKKGIAFGNFFKQLKTAFGNNKNEA
ncbi:MAG: TIGR04013 family B12-binding domain/radical SAM domain-containing protein [Candidatus Omnitrophota bacterium]|nr:MAG: TIGR04013 family B12-binding domain/radical SAM domain-containing protein [Candidatus Omnitrophota bacterium]